MLRLYLGPAGSGKSAEIGRELLELAGWETPPRLLVLVPEQYTVQKEREVLELLGNRRGSAVEVLNFRRLCDVVFRETGGGAEQPIDDSGRMLLMARALAAVKGELSVYRRAAERPEFLEKLLSLYDEFQNYRISRALLRERTAGEGELGGKIADLTLIFEAYDALYIGESQSPPDLMALCADKLAGSGALAGAKVYLDGFKDFTPAQYELCELLLRRCDLTLALCCDGLSGESPLFESSRGTARRLLRSAQAASVEAETRQFEVHDGPLAPVERALRELTGAGAAEPCPAARAFAADDPFDEIDQIATEILRLVREEGYRFRDFVLIARDAGDYRDVLEAVFPKYGIPFFADSEESALSKPLVKYLMRALDCVTRGFRREDFFEYLKSGLTPLEPAEVCELQSYCAGWNLTGSALTKPFTKHPDGLLALFDEESSARLAALEELRERAVSPLLRLAARAEEGPSELAAALYDLMEEEGVFERLLERAELLAAGGYHKLAEECRRIGGKTVEALSQLARFCGEETETSRFAELFLLAMGSLGVETIPTLLDSVTLGSANLVRTSQPKCVFVIGFCEGVFPAAVSESGLLSDAERRELAELSFALSPSAERRAAEEQFFLYTALTAPSERLYLSAPAADSRGGERRISYLFTILITRLGLSRTRLHGPLDLEGEARAAEYCFLHSGEEDELAQYLAGYFERTGRPLDFSRVRRAEQEREGRLRLSEPGLAGRLYGNRAQSPTGLERFIKCRFSYFCRYGLRVQERRKNELDALTAGTFIHSVLQCFAELVRRRGGFRALENAGELIDQVVEDYRKEHFPDFEESGGRFQYLFRRLKDTVKEFALQLSEELSHSRFTPEGLELEIGGGGIAPLIIRREGENIVLRGVIDRLDVYERDGVRYLRVVDYKTGGKEFDFTEIYEGLSLQILLYLFCALEAGGEQVRPAGVLYSRVHAPVVAVEERDCPPEEIERERRKLMRGSGLLIRDADILAAMDESGSFQNLPVKLTRGGEIDLERSDTATLPELALIRRHVERVLLRAAETLEAGDISINPYEGSELSCQFCEMSDICRSKGKKGGGRFLHRLTREEFFERIGGDEDGDKLDARAERGD